MNPKQKATAGMNTFPETENLETILRSLKAGVCRLDSHGTVLYVNEAAAVMFGLGEDELLGRKYSEVFFGDGIGREDPRCGPIEFTLEEGEVSHINTENLKREGGPDFLSEIICVPAADGSDSTGAVISFLDVTDRRLVEDAVSRARDEAVQAARSKADFLANMSHEIRTPLTGIIGTVDLLSGTDLDDEQERFLSILKTSTELLRSIVNEILDFSKIEAGKFITRSEPVVLRQFTEDIVDSFRPLSADKKLNLTVEFGGDLPDQVECDARCLQQVLNNLLSNALKFTEKGSVGVTLESLGSDQIIRFTVRDTGIGIADSQQEKLFAPFEQADSSDARRFEGSGLGLAISRRLTLLMGGEIGFESIEGGGSEFWIEIPYVISPVSAVQSGQHEVKNAPINQDLRILVVEDNPVNLMVTLRILRQIGVEAVSSGSGAEAIEACKDNEFDIVLMDCQMPDMDGYEAARRIKENGGTPTIIAFTASIGENKTEKYAASEMDGVLLKPFTKDELIHLLNRHMSSAKGIKNLDLSEHFIQHSISKFIEPEMLRQLASLDTEPRGFLKEILEVFAGHFSAKLVELQSAIKRRDHKTIKSVAHNLKGSSANIGLTKLSGHLQTLEASGRTTDKQEELLHEIETEFGLIREAIAELTAEEDMK